MLARTSFWPRRELARGPSSFAARRRRRRLHRPKVRRALGARRPVGPHLRTAHPPSPWLRCPQANPSCSRVGRSVRWTGAPRGPRRSRCATDESSAMGAALSARRRAGARPRSSSTAPPCSRGSSTRTPTSSTSVHSSTPAALGCEGLGRDHRTPAHACRNAPAGYLAHGDTRLW